MAGLTVQNFVSAAVGMAVVAALIRGIINRTSSSLGNFWQDIVRTLFYVLLPLSIVVAVLLVSGGVLQTIGHAVTATTRGGRRPAPGRRPGGVAGRHQAAGDQRRRVLQRQLGHAVRERDRVHELRRAAVDHPHPGRAHLHVRAHGRPPAPGLGDLRGHARPVPRLHRRDRPGRAARHRRPARRRPAHHRLRRVQRRQPRGQGGPQRHRRSPALWTATTTSTSNGSVNSALDSYTGLGGAVPMSGAGAPAR